MYSRAIAYFIPAGSLTRLCDAAEGAAPGEPGDRYEDALGEATLRRVEFADSGACVAVALAFLDRAGVDLHAAHQEKAERLSARREASHVVFTRGLGRAVLARFRATRIDVRALVRYDAELRGERSPGEPAPLKAAVAFLYRVLRSVRPGEEAVLVIRLSDRPALGPVDGPVAEPARAARPRGFAPAARESRLRPAW